MPLLESSDARLQLRGQLIVKVVDIMRLNLCAATHTLDLPVDLGIQEAFEILKESKNCVELLGDSFLDHDFWEVKKDA